MKFRLKQIFSTWGVVVGAALTIVVDLTFYRPDARKASSGRNAEQVTETPDAGLSISRRSYDLPFILRPPVQPEGTILVYMDDDSHSRLNQRFDAPWDRRLHTRLGERLPVAGARAIVFDVVFSDPSRDPAVDEAFARAMLAAGNVVLAADTVPADYGMDLVQMKQVTLPAERLRDAAAQIGSAGMQPSEDFVIRAHFHGDTADLLPSLSWATASLLGVEITKNDRERERRRWMNYYGPPCNLPSVSDHRAIDTNPTSDALFRNKVVFIGARLFTKFAGERKDEFRSPYAYLNPDRPFVPGVEVQATQFLNLLRGDWLARWPAQAERSFLVLFGLLIGGLLVLLRPWLAVVVAVAAVTLVGAGAYAAFLHQRVWFPWMIPMLQVGVALGWAISYNSFKLFLQKRLLEQSLSLHLSPSRVRQLMNLPELLHPGADKQELSIMFSDIADFTKISEGMDSDDLAQMMNSYFESAISAVHETDGTVIKLIGDAIFAVWNAPLAQADHRVRACQAALKLRDQPVSFVAGGKDRVLFTRIGLHTGEANVGNFGSATRFDYTALGESINLASRMEGLNKHLGTQVLMTGETHAAVSDQLLTRPLGSFQLKGFEKPVEVFELVGLLEQAEASREWRELFAQALALYKAQDLSTAKLLFSQVLHLRPEDGPSKFYIGRIEEIDTEKMVLEWGGHTRMFDK